MASGQMYGQAVLVIGGAGKVGRCLIRLLAGADYTVHAIIRKESQVADIESLGGRAVVKDLELASPDDLGATIKQISPGAIVWAAGASFSTPERTDTVDRHGAIKCMNAAASANINRYIVVSALDVRDKSKPAPSWYDESDLKRSERLSVVLRPWMEAKLDSDRELAQSKALRKLQWTIVRPGGLTDGEGTGKVSAGRVHLGQQVSREDVARVVVECLENDGTIGMAFDVVGGETPIKTAVAEVVSKKEDCFAGLY